MKVFEVTTEYAPSDSKEIITEVQYVTSDRDIIHQVTEHFKLYCKEYNVDLKGVREVLTVVQHIETK